MSYLLAALALRYALAAFLYVATVAVWISNIRGLEGIAVLGAAVIFGFIATLAWIAAIVAGRFIAGSQPRLIVQPVLILLVFAALTYLVVGILMGMPNDVVRDARPFTMLIAVVATVDAAIGWLLDGWVARRQAEAG